MKKISDPNTGEDKFVPITTNPILTQKLVNLAPRCSLGCAVVFLSSIIILFVIFGTPLLVKSYEVIEFRANYTAW